MILTYFRSLRNPQGESRRVTWDQFCAWLSKPIVEEMKESCGGFSLALYTGNRRSLANVRDVYAVGLDFDESVDLETMHKRFSRYASFTHTTHSSTPEHPRVRVFLQLSRSVTGDEYRMVYAAIAHYVEKGGLVVDRAASDPSRFWYRPATLPSRTGEFQCWKHDGAPLDVDKAIELAPKPEPRPEESEPVRREPASADIITRAEKYLATCPPAISGQGGHTHTFVVAQKLVRGFGLDSSTAFRLMSQWNQQCDPPWSDHELKRKIRQAEARGTMPVGELRDARRAG